MLHLLFPDNAVLLLEGLFGPLGFLLLLVVLFDLLMELHSLLH